MASPARGFAETHVYEPLRSHRHIRILEVAAHAQVEQDSQLSYSLVQEEIPLGTTQLYFEALSYTWGSPDRVSSLSLVNECGPIGLTANLTEALPHVTESSITKRLWIDQICINQADNVEKSIQVGLMSEIYKRAFRVIVWLGPADENSRLCKQWLEAFEKLIPSLNFKKEVTIGSPEYDPNIRKMILMDTFSSPDTSPVWIPAIGRTFSRPWFRRVWVVQEMILATELLFLTGDIAFSLQDFEDLFTAPMEMFKEYPDLKADIDNGIISYRVLMQLNTDTFTTTPEPLRFLRVMAAVGDEFWTKEPCDRLYGFLGLIEGLDFTPDYTSPVLDNFTRFAATIARQYGSLDFLSLWSANLDSRLPNTHPDFLNFPSWVPSFTATPLCAPWRLAVGGVRTWGREVSWNASASRPHIHNQTASASLTKKLHVRGQIVDHIAILGNTRVARWLDIDTPYLISLTQQLQSEIPGLEHWTYIDLVHFFNVVASNGTTPWETAEQILDLAPSSVPDEHRHLLRHAGALGACFMMGKGRRFVRTEKGRLGIVPWMDTRGRVGEERGSAIVVLHGCCVPIVLEKVDEGNGEVGEWTVVGDCYVEGIMFGEGVVWDVKDAREFILV
ncbi:hypothetical protein NX059_003859 [Plenodomus lindquistii]|nr:hypothetical protein NX059_003859 [Plenodomus lindquistii]